MILEDSNATLIPAELKIPDRDIYFPENRHFQGIPGITVTPAGSIYAVWFGGGTGEGPENFCMVARSRDRGKSWADPLFVIDHPNENIRSADPAVWIDPRGKLWLFWSYVCPAEFHPPSNSDNGYSRLYPVQQKIISSYLYSNMKYEIENMKY